MTHPKTLLIVDDAITNIRVLNGILESTYQICAATSGEEALELAAAVQMDLVLLDANMPDMDGYAVLEQLRANPRCAQWAVIMVTGDDSSASELRALTAGACDFIAKPVNPSLLKIKIERQLAIQGLNRELERLRKSLATQ
ncbi:response regulator [Limnobacter humi]|uniref:Response regulator n=1 Tax=Limnobacter humi TaxID=1778671 RepID=A0ABT1WHV3_9BURK|nr:response regulator [Limnobacter humi]MCQ8897105.1 response regulator [Limnobacter humi]